MKKPIATILHIDDRYNRKPDDFAMLRRFFDKRNFSFKSMGSFGMKETQVAYVSSGHPEIVILDLQDEGGEIAFEPGPEVGDALEQGNAGRPPLIIVYTSLDASDPAVEKVRAWRLETTIVKKSADQLADAQEILDGFPERLRKQVEVE